MSITISREELDSLEGKEPIVKSAYLWLLATRRSKLMNVGVAAIQHGLAHERGGVTERPGAQTCVNALSTLSESGLINLNLASGKGSSNPCYTVNFINL